MEVVESERNLPGVEKLLCPNWGTARISSLTVIAQKSPSESDSTLSWLATQVNNTPFPDVMETLNLTITSLPRSPAISKIR
jgi:hypothetical protein